MDLWAEIVRRAVHPATGLINDLVELQVDPGDPELHFFAGQLPDLAEWTGFPWAERSSAAGRTRSEAIAGTVGEAIERYAAAVALREVEQVLSAPWREVADQAVDPRRFALYAPEQYGPHWPFTAPSPELPLRWVSAWSLTRGREVLVPAQFVYLPYAPLPGEPTLALHTSSGLACGLTRAEAVLSALCEVIERDAFMIFWLCRLAAPRVDWPGSAGLRAEIAGRYLRPGLTYHVLDFTTDIGVPCCFAAVVEEGSAHVAMAVGAAARPVGEAAIRKAIMESVQTRVWLRQMVLSEGLRRFNSYEQVRSFEDHVHLWGDRTMLHRADFLLNAAEQVPVRAGCPDPSVAGQVEWVVQRLAAAGLEAIVVDITPEDVRALGLHVVRAIVPGAIPLSSDHRFQPLGGERLYRVPVLLGQRAPRSINDFNPVPHPFP